MLIRLRYVLADRDRHGRPRVYFRHRGRRIRLREEPGSPAFMARYADLLKQARTGTLPAPIAVDAGQGPHPGTFGWLARTYLASAAFADLDRSTQRSRVLKLEAMLDEPVRPNSHDTFASLPLAHLTPAAVAVLRDRKSGSPHAANDRVKILRGMCKWAAKSRLLPANPALGLHKVSAPIEGHHTWTEDEISAYEARHPSGTKARLALALLLYTGCRRSDVVRLGRPHLRDGRLRWTATKNRRRSPVSIDVPVLPPLEAEIDASACGEMVFLVTEQGRPFSVAGFGNWFRDRCDEAGLPQCSAHGLRKAGSTRAAEAGATPHQLMAMFGWRTLSEAERYTRAADRRRMATSGMALLLQTRNRT